ncbi:aldo/keto reductase [Alphaproteobacteria bacterium]|nr:aldo/keto reductase [Alphaproteobacteria bacterium]
MKNITLGRTDLSVSEVVLGGGWVGGLFIDPSYEVMEKALEISIKSGINWIDTAETYSEGKSEKNIGDLLSALPVKDKIYISSKASLDPKSSESFGSQIDRKLDNSLKRLKTDKLDLYQLHNKITFEEGGENLTPAQILEKNGVCDIMERIKEDSRVDHIGLTALGDTKPIRDVVNTGCFDTAQIYYNLLNPTATFKEKGIWNDQDFSNLVSDCQTQNMGILGIRVFAAGLLATDIRHGREIPVTHMIDIKEEERRVQRIYKIFGETFGNRAQLAVRYGLSAESLHCTVLGLATLEHLQNAIEAVEMGPLPEDVLEKILELQKSNFL